MEKWMMRNTASVQVNIDILTKHDGEQMAFISDCISPFVSLLFSNSPYINSEPVEKITLDTKYGLKLIATGAVIYTNMVFLLLITL